MKKDVKNAKIAEIVKNQEEIMLYLPENVYKIRKIYKMKQDAFAKLLKVSKDKLGRYERGQTNPDSIFIERLSELTGFSENELKQELLSEKLIRERDARREQRDNGEQSVQIANKDNTSDQRHSEGLTLPGSTTLRDFLEVKVQAIIELVDGNKKKLEELIDSNIKRDKEMEGLRAGLAEVQRSIKDSSLDLILKYVQLIDGRSRTMEAFLQAWIKYEADEISHGDPEKKKEKLQKLNEIFGSVLKSTDENPQNG